MTTVAQEPRNVNQYELTARAVALNVSIRCGPGDRSCDLVFACPAHGGDYRDEDWWTAIDDAAYRAYRARYDSEVSPEINSGADGSASLDCRCHPVGSIECPIHGRYIAKGWGLLSWETYGDYDLTGYDDGAADSCGLVLTLRGVEVVTSRVEKHKLFNPLSHIQDIVLEWEREQTEINPSTPSSPGEASAPPAAVSSVGGSGVDVTLSGNLDRDVASVATSCDLSLSVAASDGGCAQGAPGSTCAYCGHADPHDDDVCTECLAMPDETYAHQRARHAFDLGLCPQSRGLSSAACSTAPPVASEHDGLPSFPLGQTTAPASPLSSDQATPGRTQGAPAGVHVIAPHLQAKAAAFVEEAARHAVEIGGYDPSALIRPTVDLLATRAIQEACEVAGHPGVHRLWKADYVRLWCAYVAALAEAVSA